MIANDRFEGELERTLDECIAEQEIDENFARFVENEFIDRLNFVNAMPVISDLKRKIQALEKHEYDDFGTAIEGIREQTTAFNKTLAVRSAATIAHPVISFASDSFMTQLRSFHKSLTNPKRAIRTGLKRLNQMLGGGFMPGKVYVFMAVSGGWKSGLLLNVLLWAAKYNKDSRCRDQSRKPLYLYLTQENDTEETMDRLFSYLRAAQDGHISATPEEIYDLFIEEGIKSEHYDVRVHYYPKGTICSNDIENIVRELEDDGVYEVKLIVHDYIKRLKPNIATGDLRIDLGEAANDLSTSSKAMKLPIVTANQINRGAYDVLMQQGKNEGKNDLGKNASLTMQSESQMVTENVDWVGAINKECLTSTNEWFISFTDLKNRAAKSNKTYSNRYFAQPFEEGNSMRLMEDVDMPEGVCYGVDNIADQLKSYDPNSVDEDEGGAPAPQRRNGNRTARRISINDAVEEEAA
jgi:hypothetical protein